MSALPRVLLTPVELQKEAAARTHEMRLWLSRAATLLFFSLLVVEQGALPNDAIAAQPQPGFDCSKARSWSEREVCRDETLAALDVKLASLYSAKRAQLEGAQKAGLIVAQKQWLRDRDNCESSPSPSQCLNAIYNKRILELPPAGDNLDKGAGQLMGAQVPADVSSTSTDQSQISVAQMSSHETTIKERPPIVDVKELDTNPFPYKEQRVVVPGVWSKMLSETEAYLLPCGWSAYGIVVDGLGLSSFKAGTNCLVAIKVNGKRTVQGLEPPLVTSVTYIAQRCSDSTLSGRDAEEVDWRYVEEQLPRSWVPDQRYCLEKFRTIK